MDKMFLYIPLYNFNLSNDAIAEISDLGHEFLSGVRLIITPDVVQEYYQQVLTRQSIQLGFNGKMMFKRIDIAQSPKYCLSIDQSNSSTVSFDEIIISIIRVLKPSNVNKRYMLVYNADSQKIDLHYMCNMQFINEVPLNSKVLYGKDELSTISAMLSSWVKFNQKMLTTFSTTKIYTAFEIFKHSFLQDGIFLRIIFYVVVLECLFSPGKKPLVHKIAENAAFFLEPTDKNKRIEVYDLIRKTYKIRSEIVHTGKSETLTKCGVDIIRDARNCVARSIIKCLSDDKIINIFIDDETRRRYFKELVIGR